MFWPIKFEAMNFLNYTVETYECQPRGKENNPEEENEDSNHTVNDCEHYIIPHPKYNTHMHIHRFENHVYLPNIVGPWLPHRDCDEDSKPYYFAAMLAFLKPWRDLDDLKDHDKSWEEIFGSCWSRLLFSLALTGEYGALPLSQCAWFYASGNILATTCSSTPYLGVA
jgi:hypothetical protein